MKEFIYEIEHSWQKQRQLISEQRRRRRKRDFSSRNDAIDFNRSIGETEKISTSTGIHYRCSTIINDLIMAIDLSDRTGVFYWRTEQKYQTARLLFDHFPVIEFSPEIKREPIALLIESIRRHSFCFRSNVLKRTKKKEFFLQSEKKKHKIFVSFFLFTD